MTSGPVPPESSYAIEPSTSLRKLGGAAATLEALTATANDANEIQFSMLIFIVTRLIPLVSLAKQEAWISSRAPVMSWCEGRSSSHIRDLRARGGRSEERR